MNNTALIPSTGQSTFDDSKLGDVLLFLSADCDNHSTTKIISPYSNTTYYTVITEESGSRTQIYRGNAKGRMFNEFSHISTISAAQRHRIWDPLVNLHDATSRSADSNSPGEETLKESGDDDETVVDEKDSILDEKTIEKTIGCAEEKVTDGKYGNNRSSWKGVAGLKGALNVTKRTDRQDMLFIKYGKGASSSLGKTIKMDGTTVTIESDGLTYVWRVEDGRPALFASGDSKSTQVVWTRPAQVNVSNSETMTVAYPASLIFYPEVRPILDAILVSLIVWERKTRMQQ